MSAILVGDVKTENEIWRSVRSQVLQAATQAIPKNKIRDDRGCKEKPFSFMVDKCPRVLQQHHIVKTSPGNATYYLNRLFHC